MAAGDDADDGVGADEEEQRGKEREVLLPGLLAHDGLHHVIAHELDDVLDAVHEQALRHEARGLLLLEHEEHDEHQDERDRQPERVRGEADRGVAHDGVGHEAVEKRVNLLGELV